MARLIDLHATFVANQTPVTSLAEADGVAFSCPACFGAASAHQIEIAHDEHIVSGESIGTLTVDSEIVSPCGWRGRIDCWHTVESL